VRRAALAEVGRFDERFFLYSEDEDWQRRALVRGWRVRFCPDVVAQHASGGTETDTGRHRLRLHAAIERYVRKWYGRRGWALYRAGTLFGLTLRLVVQRGPRRRATTRLTRLYLTGPDRAARRAGAIPGP
jgi:GT2 family glycosyltransferase